MKHKRKYMLLLMTLLIALSMQATVLANTTTETAVYQPINPLWQNVNQANARLTFSGTTAHCNVTITGFSGTTRITATMRLERVVGNTAVTVRTWTQTVDGSRLTMNESATVTTTGNYRLRVDATVVRNGVSESISISG